MARQLVRSRARSSRAKLTGRSGGGGGSKVVIYKYCDAVVAHLPAVRLALRAEADVVYADAVAIFAEHNRPGGHQLKRVNGRLDAFVVLEGPAPLSVEFGRGPDHLGNDAMEGLHILGRAANL